MVDPQIDWLVMAIFPLSIISVFIIHELGHYVVARLFGVHVASFSIGYGKKIWSRTDKYGTKWSINMFPICGFIHLAGKNTKISQNDRFDNKTITQRMLIVLAGPLANIGFSLCLLWFLFNRDRS
jgi:regulator of sigma E protease